MCSRILMLALVAFLCLGSWNQVRADPPVGAMEQMAKASTEAQTPPVPATAPHTMPSEQPKQWQYRCIKVNSDFDPESGIEWMNALGLQGWELVTTNYYLYSGPTFLYCFKRPFVPSPPPPPPKKCASPCAKNQICDDGKCIELCQPSCGESQYCATDRQCYWMRNGRRTADPVKVR
jgi:hypothetical protein